MNWGWRHFLAWLRKGFVLSKTVIFILGLVLSHAFVNKGVVDVLADFLEYENYSLWKATMLVNLLDVMSAVFKLVVIHVSVAYAGRFKVIIFCTAAYTMGLVLLCVRAFTSQYIVPTIFILALIALGKAGKDPTLRDFFDYQLSKAKKKCTENPVERSESDNNGSGTTNHWWSTAPIIGSVLAVFCLGPASWTETFQFSSCVMGAACLLFILGIFCYYPEEKPSGSPLTNIYRVLKEAIKKRGLPYPSSKQGYKHEGSDDLEDPFYQTVIGEVRLLPRDPSFLSMLDKAAIKNNSEQGDCTCTAEQVRDVKSLYPTVPLGLFTFFAYSWCLHLATLTLFCKQPTWILMLGVYMFLSWFSRHFNLRLLLGLEL
ncbi:protein NRT1/ PTR FAMILY 5.4-like [Prosopis cineraria]|uniref:protein NRT1/ PTR FAMILY 5.4-like n=1 Tax=Prosopis cineraria TaxID=364024 RepID=UPI00240EDA49|nr:protein NRT1/ PTR FAMILY 5.4-like [Prosopis cineraria]XP_054785131.1 protein NRT1/ PTR FAMILY 5.4-like [Prosopis cineraria]